VALKDFRALKLREALAAPPQPPNPRIHPSAVVDPAPACPRCHVGARAVIGCGCAVTAVAPSIPGLVLYDNAAAELRNPCQCGAPSRQAARAGCVIQSNAVIVRGLCSYPHRPPLGEDAQPPVSLLWEGWKWAAASPSIRPTVARPASCRQPKWTNPWCCGHGVTPPGLCPGGPGGDRGGALWQRIPGRASGRGHRADRRRHLPPSKSRNPW